MKKQVLLLLALGLSLIAAPVTVTATNFGETNVDTDQGRTGVPVPVSVVHPYISADYIGMTLDLEFSIDERGRPGRIVSRQAADRGLVKPLIDAVSRWEFKPLLGASGEPVKAKVVLPVRIIRRAAFDR